MALPLPPLWAQPLSRTGRRPPDRTLPEGLVPPTRLAATTSLRQTDRTKQVCHEDSCRLFWKLRPGKGRRNVTPTLGWARCAVGVLRPADRPGRTAPWSLVPGRAPAELAAMGQKHIPSLFKGLDLPTQKPDEPFLIGYAPLHQ